MPPCGNRLSRSEFNDLFKVGRRQHTEVATFITHPSPQPKISVVVGKKVARLAHERNRWRRITYHQVFPFVRQGSWSVIVLLKPGVTKMARREFVTALQLAGGRIFNSQ